ncbi:unnamed protein product [Gadus morhua 'NCC']
MTFPQTFDRWLRALGRSQPVQRCLHDRVQESAPSHSIRVRESHNPELQHPETQSHSTKSHSTQSTQSHSTQRQRVTAPRDPDRLGEGVGLIIPAALRRTELSGAGGPAVQIRLWARATPCVCRSGSECFLLLTQTEGEPGWLAALLQYPNEQRARRQRLGTAEQQLGCGSGAAR